MKSQSPTIVLTGGGSGGHVTPLLSLARELKAQSPGCEIIYIGHKGDNFDSLKVGADDFDFKVFINGGKFRRYPNDNLIKRLLDLKTLSLNIRDFFRVFKSTGAAYRALRKFKPDVVFSKGGFVVVPVGIAARLLRIPIITHDSDTVPGLANRIVGRWAAVHATGMPADLYTYPRRSIKYTGIPLDPRIKKVTPRLQSQARKELGLPEDAKVVLISGGGNGSRRLNEMMTAVAAELLENDLSIHILHLAGRSNQAATKHQYESLPKLIRQRVKLESYTPDFYIWVAAADLIVTRAGATTVAELAAAGKACVVIPAPFLAEGHQLKNARELAKREAAVVVDNDIAPDEFIVIIKGLLNDDHRRFQLAKNLYATAKTDAATKLADLVLAVAEDR